jgi:hypothetical protein
MHVDQVLGDVPQEKRCKCKEARGAVHPEGNERSLWKRLLG